MKKLFTVAAIGLLLASSLAGGTKEELQRLQNDILQLQSLIRTLVDNQERTQGSSQDLLEQLNDRTAQVEASIKSMAQAMRNRAQQQEQQSAEWREAFQRLVVKIDDTNNRIAALQQKLDESQMKIQSVRNVTPDIGGSAEPDRVYGAAYNDYIMGNYELAIAAFRDFLTSFPDSEYSDNAAYYLGVSHMEQGRCPAAVQAFQEVINLYPGGDKLVPSRYKMALCQEQLGRRDEAIETFKDLIELHPDSPEAALAKNELERLGVPQDEDTRQ
ncbi:MAG TPA: tetratricopeptide repeat protein [Acidobacteriota bacterium]|nr:tetratricopeptide repeat protein [Acidobacteriota bacterium]